MGDWLTPDEVAAQLSVTVWTVRRWLRDGMLAGMKLGPRTWRIKQTDVDEYLKQARNK